MCFILGLALARVFVGPAQAATVTLAWDPSAYPTVFGYHLYYGGASLTYTSLVAVGVVTNGSITGLAAGSQYFFAATAVNGAGLESPFSNEVSYQVPGTAASASVAVVSSSANPSAPGSPVTFTAAVSAVGPGAGVPTGTVQFVVDGAPAGGPGTLIGGAANYSTSALGWGLHTVGIEYGGGGSFAGTTNTLGVAQLVVSSVSVGVPPLALDWAPPAQNLAIANLGNGTIAVGGQGVPGGTYVIEYAAGTPATTNWLVLGTVTADAAGSFVLIDPAGSGARFYRALYP